VFGPTGRQARCLTQYSLALFWGSVQPESRLGESMNSGQGSGISGRRYQVRGDGSVRRIEKKLTSKERRSARKLLQILEQVNETIARAQRAGASGQGHPTVAGQVVREGSDVDT
jgi:hypothetical protein